MCADPEARQHVGTFLDDRRFELHWWHDHRTLRFADLDSALAFLRRFMTGGEDAAALRELLAESSAEHPVWRMSDDQVLRALADDLQAGRLVLFEHVRRRRGGGADIQEEPAAAATPERTPRSSAPASPPPAATEPPTLPGVAPAAQAGTARTASEHGTAVCEICEQQAAAQGGSGQQPAAVQGGTGEGSGAQNDGPAPAAQGGSGRSGDR